jgi:peptide chain release factor 1
MQEIRGNLVAKLEAASQRYDQVAAEMNDPATAVDRARIVALAKEHHKLTRIVEPYRKYRTAVDQYSQAKGIIDDPSGDPEMKELAQEELADLEKQADALMEEIQGLLVMSDKADIDSVLLEIRAGTGGEEAALFAGDLMNMYVRFAERRGWKVEVLDASPTDLGGFREVILNVKGDGVFQALSFEGGGHRVQRVPKTETQGRIHTSAATVAVLPEPEEVEVTINWDKDVLEFVSRAGGPGGQNVNKVASAIRLEHVPTGITVSMREEKSQHKNRAKARRVLATRVYEFHRQAQVAIESAARKSMVGSGDRSQRIRTYNYPQSRCTDHRLKGHGSDEANFNLQTILNGDLDELVNALVAQEKVEKLASL